MTSLARGPVGAERPGAARPDGTGEPDGTGHPALRGLPAVWLRANCPCADCQDPGSGQRLAAITGLPADVTVARVLASDAAVEVIFGPDGHGRFSPRTGSPGTATRTGRPGRERPRPGEVNTEAVSLGIAIREQPALQHLVRRKAPNSGDHIRRGEGSLFHLCEVVFRITIEFHYAHFDQWVVSLRPDFGQIKRIVLVCLCLFLCHYLDEERPSRKISTFDGLQ